MPSSVEQLRQERRRKLQVRESFIRGLQYFRSHPSDPLSFYLAGATYLATGQRRLIDQDRRLVEILAPRVPGAERDDHQAIEALRSRLDLANRSLGEFEKALEDFRRAGRPGRAGFEAAADRFLDVLVNVLGARSHSLRHLTTTLLKEEDWARIAGITPQSLAAEEERFAAVARAAPKGLDPAGMSAEPPVKPAETLRSRPT